MNRTNRILLAALAVQLIAIAAVFWPRQEAAGQAGQALFPGLQADQIVRLTIAGPDGRSVQLRGGAEGWVLPEADDFPVPADKVPTLLAQIVALKGGQPVTTTPDAHKRLRVAADSFERKLEFELNDGTRHTLYIGSSPSYGSAHVRADDQNEVYLAADLAADDAGFEPSSWVDQTYLSIPTEQVTSLNLQNAQGTFVFVKSGNQWTLEGLGAEETLDQSQVTAMLNRLSPLTMLRPLGREQKPEYGMTQPAAIVTVNTRSDQGEKAFLVKVGAQDPSDKSYVVISSESPYYVRVSEYVVKNLVTGDRTTFLAKPTATPVPTATPAQ